jgi:hypothetical protein
MPQRVHGPVHSGFFYRRLYHGFMKADWRISVKDYSRNKPSKSRWCVGNNFRISKSVLECGGKAAAATPLSCEWKAFEHSINFRAG